jgi:hypothetical protein
VFFFVFFAIFCVIAKVAKIHRKIKPDLANKLNMKVKFLKHFSIFSATCLNQVENYGDFSYYGY